MAISTCAKCSGTFFEMKTAEPKNSRYKKLFIQCSACGAVVGVSDYHDSGVLAKDNQRELADLKKVLKRIESLLARRS